MKLRILVLASLASLVALGQNQAVPNQTLLPASGQPVVEQMVFSNPSGACIAGSPKTYNWLSGAEYGCAAGSWIPLGSTASMVYPNAGLAASNGSAWVTPTYGLVVGLFGGSGSCYLKKDGTCDTPASGGSMVYPPAGIGVSTGSAWGTAATYSNIVGLFASGSCSGYLKSTGGCDTPAGGSATPGGSTTQVQYNLSGAFAGDSGFTYNATSHLLTATGGFTSGGSTAGFLQLTQGTATACASNSLCFEAPTSVTTSTLFNYPAAVPAAGQVMAFSAPSSGVSTGSWVTPMTSLAIQQGGSAQSTATTLNCGTNMTCSTTSGVTTIAAASGGGGGSTFPAGPSSQWWEEQFCNFSYNGDQFGISTTNSSESDATNFVDANHPCSFDQTTAASAGSYAGLRLGQGGGNGTARWPINNKTFDARWNMAVGRLTSMLFYVGFGAADGTLNFTANGAYVRFDTSKSDTVYQYVVCASSTCTPTSSGVTPDTSFHTFRIRSTTAGTLLFSIDGGTETSVASGLPTANVTAGSIAQTSAATALTLRNSYWGAIINGLSR